MTEYEKIRKKNLCVNCGKPGHEFKYCREPITSYGIININIADSEYELSAIRDKFSTKKNTTLQIVSDKYPNVKCYISDNIKLENRNEIFRLDDQMIPYEDEEQIRKFCYYKDKIMFMMVSRKFSLGFIEFVRGKYDVTDAKTIINLFEQMYEEEIKYIRKNNYDNVLYHFLNRDNEPIEIVLNRIYESKYSNEYCEAKIKYSLLKNPDSDQNIDIPLSLDFYTKYIKPRWRKPEWGFPKGRRDKRNEENLGCACREFEEETGYADDEYTILNKVEPIEENLTGTNGISYKHVYYLSLNNSYMKNHDEYDSYEIGEIKWFTYHEAMTMIRPYHIDKKNILTRIYLFLLNFLIHNV